MGKSGKNKKQAGRQAGDGNVKKNKVGSNSHKTYDKDMEIFISMSHELKEEGNKLFRRRDHEGALLKYEKAIELLPRNHIDVSYLRSNMAACYMQMGLSEYPRAIHECNLALEVTPKYSKALLKRARCYEALNTMELALRDVSLVLKMEPNNVMASEISERVKNALEQRGMRVNDTVIELPPEYVDPIGAMPTEDVAKREKIKKNKGKKGKNIKAGDEVAESKSGDEVAENEAGAEVEEQKAEVEEMKARDEIEEIDDQIEEKAKDKVVVEEKISGTKEELKKIIKLALGEDIRWAQLPLNCTVLQLREVICDRFPGIGPVLIKYRDQEGDLITLTTDEELKWAEASAEFQGSVKLYLVEVNPQHDPFFDRFKDGDLQKLDMKQNFLLEDRHVENGHKGEQESYHIDEWMVDFAKMFKNHGGFDFDGYLGLHELGMKVYSEAMEETVTCEEAQDLFSTAAGKFQEMAALALFNWGNVHMSRARKRVYLEEDASRDSVLEQIKTAYDWAQQEYIEAGQKYEEALKIKQDFYEGFLALGQQQFEQAKLSWYYAISNNVDLETWSSDEVVQLYNSAEDNMERGTEMWGKLETQRLNEDCNPMQVTYQLQKTGFNRLFKDLSAEEATEQAKNMRSQINILWGTILYERSIMEFKLGLPVWRECLEVAIEKFELAGASPTDIAVIIKNHVSNDTALDGLGFRVDEIVQAWHEMYEAKMWQRGVPSYRLEPLLRRRVSKLYHALELA